MKKISVFIFLFFSSTWLFAQDNSLFARKQLISKGDTLPYRILLPKDFSPKKRYPLFIFLHGAGERGSDNTKQLTHGASLFLNDTVRTNFQAIIVFPQCSADSYWSNVQAGYNTISKSRIFTFKADGEPTKAMSLLLKLCNQLDKDYKIDTKRKYVGGLSMGGMGTFELVNRNPKTFAAAFAICGGANTATAPALKQTAWWIFHGLKDDVVNPQFSIDMANALKASGAEVKLTLYPEANHNSWDAAFAEPDLLPWLFSHVKK